MIAVQGPLFHFEFGKIEVNQIQYVVRGSLAITERLQQDRR